MEIFGVKIENMDSYQYAFIIMMTIAIIAFIIEFVVITIELFKTDKFWWMRWMQKSEFKDDDNSWWTSDPDKWFATHKWMINEKL
jgi:hypothetical protein